MLLVVILGIVATRVHAQEVFVNEIHYVNDGTDADGAFEITRPARTNLTGWALVRYTRQGRWRLMMYATKLGFEIRTAFTSR